MVFTVDGETVLAHRLPPHGNLFYSLSHDFKAASDSGWDYDLACGAYCDLGFDDVFGPVAL